MTHIFLMDAAPGPCNAMLDLETWGTALGSAIRSVGAVMFDPHSYQIDPDGFYMNISDASCEQAGLVKDADTVAWWTDSKRKQAQDSLATDQRTLTEAAVAFHSWFRSHRGIFVWSQGANFDEPLWSVAVRKVKQTVPWKYWDVRDTRTAYDLAQFDARTVRRNGTYHNALDDARHQAVCVQRAYAKINKERWNGKT